MKRVKLVFPPNRPSHCPARPLSALTLRRRLHLALLGHCHHVPVRHHVVGGQDVEHHLAAAEEQVGAWVGAGAAVQGNTGTSVRKHACRGLHAGQARAATRAEVASTRRLQVARCCRADAPPGCA